MWRHCIPLVFAMADIEAGMAANGGFAGSLQMAENFRLCYISADRIDGGPGIVRPISQRGHFSRAVDGGPGYCLERLAGEPGGMDVINDIAVNKNPINFNKE